MTLREFGLYGGMAAFLLFAALDAGDTGWCRFYLGVAVAYLLAANIVGAIHASRP